MFGQTFNQWNACHRLLPNIILENREGSAPMLITDIEQEEKWNVLEGIDWPKFSEINEQTIDQLPSVIRQEIKSHFQNPILKTKVNVSEDIKKFCDQHLDNYKKTYAQFNDLTKNGFLVTNVPIKLQTLAEKKMIINNFDESIEWYNDWATINDYELYTENDILKLADQEEKVLIRSITESTNLPAVK